MKVLALISGGKDSCLAMHLCKTYGHEVVALGNIAPDPSLQKDDLDSWMFQTIGHNVIESYTVCTGNHDSFTILGYRKHKQDCLFIEHGPKEPQFRSLYRILTRMATKSKISID